MLYSPGVIIPLYQLAALPIGTANPNRSPLPLSPPEPKEMQGDTLESKETHHPGISQGLCRPHRGRAPSLPQHLLRWHPHGTAPNLPSLIEIGLDVGLAVVVGGAPLGARYAVPPQRVIADVPGPALSFPSMSRGNTLRQQHAPPFPSMSRGGLGGHKPFSSTGISRVLLEIAMLA
jgi:hypothetical protein